MTTPFQLSGDCLPADRGTAVVGRPRPVERSRAAAASGASAARLCQVEVISDHRSLLALEPVWNDLVKEAQLDHPFSSHAWVRTWWECFGAGRDLHVLLVRARGKPIAIAPLMVTRGRMYGVRARRLESIGNAHTPRFDFIVARGREEEACRTIWEHARSQRHRWNVLQLAPLAPDSSAVAELSRGVAADGYLVGRWSGMNSPYVMLNGSWEDAFRRLGPAHRKNVRNKLNRLRRRGRVVLEEISSAAHVASALEEGLRLEAAAWKGRAGTAIASRAEVGAFYRRLAERAADTGTLLLHFLTVDGERIAFEFALRHGEKIYSLKGGYDPRYARYSPGALLFYHVLRDASDRGVVEYHLLGAADPWKLEWTKTTTPYYWLFALPPGPRWRLLYAIKFRLLPRLKQQRFYGWLHAATSRTHRIPAALWGGKPRRGGERRG